MAADSLASLARSIQSRAADLLAEYKRQLGMSGDGRDNGERSAYSDADVEFLRRLDGDIMILGAGGKMGPSLARLCRNAANDVVIGHVFRRHAH